MNGKLEIQNKIFFLVKCERCTWPTKRAIAFQFFHTFVCKTGENPRENFVDKSTEMSTHDYTLCRAGISLKF